MKPVIIIAIVVAMIGVMVPSAFALSYDVIMIKDPKENVGGRNIGILSNHISLDGNSLGIICDGDICIFDSDTGKMKKIIRADSFSQYGILGFENIILQDNTIFAEFMFDMSNPSYVCPTGIAMIDFDSGNLLKIFKDDQLSGIYGQYEHEGRSDSSENNACSESYARYGDFKVFEDYLVVSAPATRDINTQHPDYRGMDVIQKSKIFLYDIVTGNLIHIFEDLDSEIYPIPMIRDTYAITVSYHDIFTKLGEQVAINENFIVLSNPVDIIASNGIGEIVIYDTNTKSHLFTIPNPFEIENKRTYAESKIAISGKNIFVSDPFNSKVHQINGDTGQLVRTYDSPNNQEGFGFEIASSDNLLLISQQGMRGTSIGTVYIYDISTGEFVKELKNADPTPGHYWGGQLIGDRFGYSISISGDKFAISAPGFLDYPVFLYFPIDASKVMPIISFPDDIIVFGDTTTGTANVDYTVTAKDYKGNPIIAKCNPSSGSLFLEGTETVTCIVTDSGGNTATETFKVIVKDVVNSKTNDDAKIILESPKIEKLEIASFIDTSKDPQHYIDRYNNEPSYKEWFDENYSQYSSIYEAIGMENPVVEYIPERLSPGAISTSEYEDIRNQMGMESCETKECAEAQSWAMQEYAIETGQYVDPFASQLPKESGGGCLIATATYGSELAPQVQQLREIRDNSLLQTESGTQFMQYFNDFYYSFSPYIADYERENPVFKEMVKIAITPMISSLSILNYVDMDSEAEVLGYGISLILLNLGMYLGVPAIIVIGIRKIK